MDIVPGVQGVWVGWQRGATTGVLRAEVGVDKAGNHCASCFALQTNADPHAVIQTVPLALPVMTPPAFDGVGKRTRIHSTLQSMSFISTPAKDEAAAESVAAVLVYEDHGKLRETSPASR